MDKEILKKPEKTTFEKLYMVSQIALLVATAVVTTYQINELFFKKDKKA